LEFNFSQQRMTWCVCIDHEKQIGKVYDIHVEANAQFFCIYDSYVKSIGQKSITQFFYNPL
jgi:hypothetical protein